MNGGVDDSGEKEPPLDEENKVKDVHVGDGQGPLKDGDLKINEEISIRGEAGQESLQSQHQYQQSQGTPFCWERFLHIRTIKVLLVEYDDSTRHVVAALLRNCNYEVIEVSNGIQAWKVLEDLANHVDLILSEVVMPCVSGIGLLCKIMSHKSRKNIPVIMMSSHDSMGLVFKCLSKGAVDFLVKPIRKNELKNLWQHVWRRCHSSSGSGSGSESGSQTQKSIKSKSSENLENYSGSNDKEDDGSDGLNIGDGSNDGSGAQSSWTKQPTEIDSSQETYPVDQAAECEDSTCAQVIYSNPEVAAIIQSQEIGAGNCQLLQPGETVKLEVKSEAIEAASNHIGAQQDLSLERDPIINRKVKDKSSVCPKNDCRSNNHQVVCTTASSPDSEFKRSGVFLQDTDKVGKVNYIPNNSENLTVELSIKRSRGVQETGKDVQGDHNILRHSELSAFSRYNASTTFSTPNCIGVTRSSSVIDKSLDGGTKELDCDIHCHSYDTPLKRSSKRGSNSVGIGSVTNKLLPSPLLFQSEVTSTMDGMHPTSAFQPVKKDGWCSTQVNVVKQSDIQYSTLIAPASGSHQHLPIQQPHHHHHHHYHINHFHNFESDQQMSNNEELSLRKMAADAPHCGSSNVPGVLDKANLLKYSLERSTSGSNYGSNGNNGSSNAMNACRTNGESDTVINLQSGSGDANGSGSGSGCGNRIDLDRLAQREAALAKFRQKRKDRCFKKRVRYQNRKRLAELRPRVRGQFVKKMEQDNSSSDETDEQ